MPLIINLKPNEKLYVGGAVIQNNSDGQCELSILNDAPLLRSKEIMKESEADTYCKRLYLCIQMMYMDNSNLASYQARFADLIGGLVESVPSTVDLIAQINLHLAVGRYYQALKTARQLVELEQELLSHVKQPT